MIRIIVTASMALTFAASFASEAGAQYKYNPLAKGSTRTQRAQTATPTPRPIQVPKLQWVDPGGYQRFGTANYGSGTSKSGPDGQRLKVHTVPYLNGSGGSSAPVGTPPRISPPPTGAPQPRKNLDYDEKRTKRW